MVDAIKYVLVSIFGIESLWGVMVGFVSSLAVGVFVGAPITIGYHRFLMDLLDLKQEIKVKTLFSGFRDCYWKSVALNLLLGLIHLGVLLVVGILLCVIFMFIGVAKPALIFVLCAVVLLVVVALSVFLTFRFFLCHHILEEYPNLCVMDVLRNSDMLMKGNVWRCICLQLSFFGWLLLAACTGGLGMIVLKPYMDVANAAFYAEISGRDTAKEVEFPSIDPNDYFPSV